MTDYQQQAEDEMRGPWADDETGDYRATVEVTPGLPAFLLYVNGDRALDRRERDVRERVRSALDALPARRITAHVRASGFPSDATVAALVADEMRRPGVIA